MGEPREPEKIKLFCGAIYADRTSLNLCKEAMTDRFGPIDIESEHREFTHTDYYSSEMGRPLWRHFFSFEKLVEPDVLAEAKLFTKELEKQTAVANGRKVNLDPGLLELAKVVLASTKNFYQRIYLKDGIYAELTLYFEKGDWRELPWTYPDYANAEVRSIMADIRRRYQDQIRLRTGEEE